MPSAAKPLSTFGKVTLSLVAIVVVSSVLFSPKEPSVSKVPQTGAEPLDSKVSLGREPDTNFSYVSARGDGQHATFGVSVWSATNGAPCTAEILSIDGRPRLQRMAKMLELGSTDDRRGVVALVLSHCAHRFVYLDGGDAIGHAGEFIGLNVPEVDNSFAIKFSSPRRLVLELYPGQAPAPHAEIKRLETLITDARRVLAETGNQTHGDGHRYTDELAEFQAALLAIPGYQPAPIPVSAADAVAVPVDDKDAFATKFAKDLAAVRAKQAQMEWENAAKDAAIAR